MGFFTCLLSFSDVDLFFAFPYILNRAAETPCQSAQDGRPECDPGKDAGPPVASSATFVSYCRGVVTGRSRHHRTAFTCISANPNDYFQFQTYYACPNGSFSYKQRRVALGRYLRRRDGEWHLGAWLLPSEFPLHFLTLSLHSLTRNVFGKPRTLFLPPNRPCLAFGVCVLVIQILHINGFSMRLTLPVFYTIQMRVMAWAMLAALPAVAAPSAARKAKSSRRSTSTTAWSCCRGCSAARRTCLRTSGATRRRCSGVFRHAGQKLTVSALFERCCTANELCYNI
jgi:hypothetical protein